jgi:hypothetical protein
MDASSSTLLNSYLRRTIQPGELDPGHPPGQCEDPCLFSAQLRHVVHHARIIRRFTRTMHELLYGKRSTVPLRS